MSDNDNIIEFTPKDKGDRLVYTLTCPCGGQDYAIISENPYSTKVQHFKICLTCNTETELFSDSY